MTAGSLLVAFVAYTGSGVAITLSDSQNNTWLPCASRNDNGGGNLACQAFYLANAPAGSLAVTAAFASGVGYPVLYVSEYAGVAGTSPLDAARSDSVRSATPTTGLPFATSQAGDLVACGIYGYPVVTAGGSGYTLRHSHGGGGWEDQVSGAAGSVQASYTCANSDIVVLSMAAFKAAAGTIRTFAVTDQITLSDTLAKGAMRSLISSLSLTSRLANSPGKLLTASLVWSDALSRTAGWTFQEGLPWTEGLARGAGRLFVETLPFAETMASVKARLLAFADSPAWTESLTRSTLRSFGESLTWIDSSRKALSRAVLPETLAWTETLGRTTGRFLTESLPVSDTLDWLKGVLLVLSESLLPSEELRRATGRALMETLSWAETLGRAMGRALVEALPAAETAALARSLRQVLAEMLSLAEALSKGSVRTLAEALPLSEAPAGKSLARALLDLLPWQEAAAFVRGSVAEALRVFRVRASVRGWPVSAVIRRWPVSAFERSWAVSHNEGSMITTTKDPAASEDFQLDWTDEVGADSIAASAWQVPTGLTAGPQSNTAKTATVRLAGGVPNHSYIVTNLVTLQSGQIKARSLRITVDLA